jgi:hypothetical protein
MGAMVFEKDLVAKDASASQILEQKDDVSA